MAIVPSGTTTELGTTDLQTLRAAGALLTNSYVVCTNDLKIDNYDQVEVLFTLTKVAGMTSFEARISISQDGTNWFPRPNKSTAGSTTVVVAEDPITYDVSAMSNGVNRLAPLAFIELAKYVRVEVKATGTVALSDILVEAIANKR